LLIHLLQQPRDQLWVVNLDVVVAGSGQRLRIIHLARPR
jgi:hypothetical protein